MSFKPNKLPHVPERRPGAFVGQEAARKISPEDNLQSQPPLATFGLDRRSLFSHLDGRMSPTLENR